jgi:hypothetical protein
MRDSYVITSNHEGGYGRFDVMLLPKNKQNQGILLEFKTSETVDGLVPKAQEALDQIKDKKYFSVFKQHEVRNVLAIGLAFCGKKVELREEMIDIVL